ncbi:hypothetical protein ACCO45_009244 [Purpureocillium lilacinum]|uniref:Uncharacterized protein n=1 Tax=Purpureocillium lilacinum TaxID=33203 RepID=A0ACC4DK06_PURLI
MGPPPPQVLLTPPPATSAGMARRRWPPPEGLQKRHRPIPLPPPEQPIPGRRPPQSAPERCGHPYSAKWPYACASLSRLAVELRAQTHPTRPGLAPGGDRRRGFRSCSIHSSLCRQPPHLHRAAVLDRTLPPGEALLTQPDPYLA